MFFSPQPENLPGYGISSTTAPPLPSYSNQDIEDDYDPYDVPADQVLWRVSKCQFSPKHLFSPGPPRRGSSGRVWQRCCSSGNLRSRYGITFLGIFDRNLSPVPDDAFTNNDVLTSYDSYDTPVIDLTNSEDQDNSINDVIVLKDDYVDQGKLVFILSW